METKNLKVVTTALSHDSVTISISVGSEEFIIDLPVRFVEPEISLRLAGAIASSPKLPRDENCQGN